MVADKQAGLLCVPGLGEGKQDCLSRRVQALYPDALIVHRLDMATSGLCLFARGLEMQRRFSAAFAERKVDKRYAAVVAGEPASAAADAWSEIDLPIAADWPLRPRRKIDFEQGKPSLTRWRVGGPGPMPGTMRLDLQPVTGRTHQLRVHLHAIGHPIVGDALYAPVNVAQASPRLLLHACELALTHPATGAALHWRSAAPF